MIILAAIGAIAALADLRSIGTRAAPRRSAKQLFGPDQSGHQRWPGLEALQSHGGTRLHVGSDGRSSSTTVLVACNSGQHRSTLLLRPVPRRRLLQITIRVIDAPDDRLATTPQVETVDHVIDCTRDDAVVLK